MGTPSLSIGGNDMTKVLKAAAYVAASAFIAALASNIQALDFSQTALAGVNGQVIATGVVNLILYFGKLYFTDTRE